MGEILGWNGLLGVFLTNLPLMAEQLPTLDRSVMVLFSTENLQFCWIFYGHSGIFPSSVILSCLTSRDQIGIGAINYLKCDFLLAYKQ